MRTALLNVGLVLLFIVIGGLFAAAEIALVSLREGQVRGLAGRGKRGARVAKLASDPNRFLAAVQVGVTLAGFLSAAFGASTLSRQLAPQLERLGLSPGLASGVSFVLMVLVITYFSLVLSELAPKRLALQRAEGTALLVAGVIDRLATLSRPMIWVLSRSTDVVVRLLGGDPKAQREVMTEEELRDLVAAQESLTPDERKIVEDVFTAGDRLVREVMVPRTEVDFLDAALPVAKAAAIAAESSHSRFPVVRGSQDAVVGFVHVRDLFVSRPAGRRPARVGDLARKVALLPTTKKLLPALSELRGQGQHIAVIVDEYGGTAGIVTLEDLIEELIGDIRDEYDSADSYATRLGGGEVEVDGLLNLDDFAEATGVELPEGPYETVAGYVMAALGRVAVDGDAVEVEGSRLTVTAVDGRRVARVRVTPISAPSSEPAVRLESAEDSLVENRSEGSSSGSVVVAGPGVSQE